MINLYAHLAPEQSRDVICLGCMGEIMSLDEMIRFLKAINHPFSVHDAAAALVHFQITSWEERHRPED